MITNAKNSLYVLLFALAICLSGCKEGDPGPGFDEGLKYGNIKVILSGKRPKDSVEFKSTQDFKYYTAGSQPYSDISTDTDTGVRTFGAYRVLSGVDAGNSENYIYVSGKISASGELTDYSLQVNTSVIDGTKYFGINQNIYSDDTNDVCEITKFKFDAATGAVKFNFTWNVAKKNSSTEHDLKVEGTVNIKVFEGLSSPK